jgi:AcrR family transcriptional regulator
MADWINKRNEELQLGASVSEPGSVRPGGRTAKTRAAVVAATLEQLAARGYEQVSVEDIALRAGVHKTTVYRRWGTKEQLVADALRAAAESRVEVPDAGEVEADLRDLARAIQATLTSQEGAATVRAIVSGARSSPEVAGILRRFWEARLALVGTIVERAVARGQLPPETNAAELMRYVAAPLFHRLLVMAEPLTTADADQAAAAAVAAARAGVFVSGPT